MALLSESDQQLLRTEFAALKRDVALTLVTHESALVVPGEEVPYGREARLLLEEVAAQSPRIKLEVRDVQPSDEQQLGKLGAERLPALLFGAPGSAKLRFFGLPAGYELSTVIATILELGGEDTDALPAPIAEG